VLARKLQANYQLDDSLTAKLYFIETPLVAPSQEVHAMRNIYQEWVCTQCDTVIGEHNYCEESITNIPQPPESSCPGCSASNEKFALFAKVILDLVDTNTIWLYEPQPVCA